MKRIAIVFIIGLFLIGCESESAEINAQQFNLPEWLKGDYEGVHTGKYLQISNERILFMVEEQAYQFQPDMIISETEEENRYIIFTDTAVLLFNKTTIEEEINFRFNELNLGWFRKGEIE